MALTFLGGELNPLSRRNAAAANIIIWCTGVWLFSTLLSLIAGTSAWLDYFKFTPDFSRLLWQPWSIFTYSFLHADFLHLLVNMIWLYFIGAILESMTGKVHVWKLFIGGAIAGAILYLIFWQLFLNDYAAGVHSYAFMVGASGGVTAVIVGTATMFPRYTVMLFGIVPVELMWIAVFRVILDLLGASGPVNTGGYICHLGGAFFGLIYMLHIRGIVNIPLVDRLAELAGRLKNRKSSKPNRNIKVEINRTRSAAPAAKKTNQDEIDRILDKINQGGYDSLTKVEKETLFRAGE